MALIDLLADRLDNETSCLLRKHSQTITELRLRAARKAVLVLRTGQRITGDIVSAEKLRSIINCLMRNSLYACEEELKQGYFSSIDGCRVGVCGQITAGRDGIDNMSSIGSICIRFPKQIIGCAAALAGCFPERGLCSLLILSPPGMGKTTMLRDLTRILSDGGRNIAVADERREIAGCMEGIPRLDVGCNTDVMDGLPKALAIPMLVRACRPDMIALDELGGKEDALAVLDAVRSGVSVIATAHASSMDDARRRQCTAMLLNENVFQYCALLGGKPGQIKSLRACANERF